VRPHGRPSLDDASSSVTAYTDSLRCPRNCSRPLPVLTVFNSPASVTVRRRANRRCRTPRRVLDARSTPVRVPAVTSLMLATIQRRRTERPFRNPMRGDGHDPLAPPLLSVTRRPTCSPLAHHVPRPALASSIVLIRSPAVRPRASLECLRAFVVLGEAIYHSLYGFRGRHFFERLPLHRVTVHPARRQGSKRRTAA